MDPALRTRAYYFCRKGCPWLFNQYIILGKLGCQPHSGVGAVSTRYTLNFSSLKTFSHCGGLFDVGITSCVLLCQTFNAQCDLDVKV